MAETTYGSEISDPSNSGVISRAGLPSSGGSTLLRAITLAIQYHPPTGYTVPSAGSEVLLHNGDPLYGAGAPPSFIPMMRQTEVIID